MYAPAGIEPISKVVCCLSSAYCLTILPSNDTKASEAWLTGTAKSIRIVR